MNVRILCDILAVSTVDARTVRPPMDQVGTEVSCLSCNININAPCCALEKLSKVANGAQGDADGRPDVARADGRLLHVDIRLAALRRVPVGAGRKVLRPVHGGCVIQLSAAGARACN